MTAVLDRPDAPAPPARPGPAVTVYPRLGTRDELCPCCGTVARRQFYGRKVLTPTGETVPYDNGYETSRQPVYTDAQGRRWLRRVTVDYADNVTYWCAGTGWSATTREPRDGVRADRAAHAARAR